MLAFSSASAAGEGGLLRALAGDRTSLFSAILRTAASRWPRAVKSGRRGDPRGLALRFAGAISRECAVASVSPPMSARSSSSSGSRPSTQCRTSLRAGTWRRPIRYDGKAGERRLNVMRRGLVPFWAKDIKVGFANINAKAEGIGGKPAFREAFQRRRCLVPVDNFFEWAKTASGKQPYAIALADRGIMALAGLWETWRSPTGETVRSFAIVTTTPNALCAEIHNRMPVILAPDAWPVWVGEEPADPPDLKALLAPHPAEEIISWPVSPRVGNVRNNDPSLIERDYPAIGPVARSAGGSRENTPPPAGIMRERSSPWAGTPRGPVSLSLPQNQATGE